MRNWFKRNRTPRTPAVEQATIGEVEIRSGTALLADPVYIYDPVKIEGIPSGRVPVVAQIIHYPEGGRHVARIGVRFRPGDVQSRQALGTIGVDSGTVVLMDAQAYDQFWKDVGPERIGRTSTPKEHRRVARLIEERFGLKSRDVDILHSEFLEPISEDLEARITAYLKTFPEYADFPFMYFRVETRNTLSRIQEAMQEGPWGEVVLDEQSGMNLLAASSGFGDGSYHVEGSYRFGELLGAEVEFIGPDQDKVLAAFLHLRYGGGPDRTR